MASTLNLQIITPEAVVFSEEVEMVTLPAIEGQIGVMPQHVPLMTHMVPGEAIVRKGQEGTSMFVIIRGSVRVQIPESTYQKTLGKLGEDDFFGEMSLLTGEPRSASVIAEEETEVLRIEKDAMKPIFENNPTLVQSICDLIEERRIQLAPETDENVEETGSSRKGVVVRSIKRFFGLN